MVGACPSCQTEDCWYSRDDTDSDGEIWRCENGHEFKYSPVSGPVEGTTTWGNWRWWKK